VPSRVFVGVGAWLVGAASATAGSIYAVAQLGQGLVEQHTTQVSVAMVNAELAQGGGAMAATGPVTGSSPTASHTPAKRHSGGQHRAVPPLSGNPGRLLTSPGGTTIASCSQDRAELLSSSPYQGFQEARFVGGPSAVASVTFTNSSIGVIMKVTCDAGVPVAHVSEFQVYHHDE
jgi:hypothetical protein